MIEWLKRIFSSGEDPRAELQGLQREFRQRYAAYLRLLEANQQAVETIAQIEAALDGGRPLTMAYVRVVCTRMAAFVFKMIQQMDRLAPERYAALFERFTMIQAGLNPILFPVASSSAFPYVVPLETAGNEIVEQVGAKMAVLGELGDIEGAGTPRGFVITSRAYQRFVEEGDLRERIDAILATTKLDDPGELHEAAAEIGALIGKALMPTDLAAAVERAGADLESSAGPDTRLAVRSSALGEDSSEMSFAGQYRSLLDVPVGGLLDAYREVIGSKYSAQALRYRAHYGLKDEDVPMCVGCMTMVDAVAGGVIYTRDPIDPADGSIGIFAVQGAPSAVVDGGATADRYVVSRDGAAGLRDQEVVGARPSLTVDQALALARVARRIEERYGAPQDIEWAIEAGGEILLLQSRPLGIDEAPAPALGETADPKRVLVEGGLTASRGAAAGRVRPIRTPADERLFQPGEVLVARSAEPALAALLDRAAAVVTERGSVACHLATVAREFGVPALLGLPGALAALASERVVTVDADGRAVYSGALEGILERPRPRPRVNGSPVHQALEEAAASVVPLNLLDPSAPEFAPEGCRTYHDITRFCHEQAVGELLRFGADHDLAQHASRRLFTDVATQFWVVDLDDGVDPGADDPHFVRLAEIRSAPMLALWRGMQLVPWEGPPSVDARGFMDLLAGAATDADLNPALPSKYSAGSHFFVARSYCSFQYRVGYHFATVEALIGEDVDERFVRFQFSGGGASEERRHRRARLIGEILEQLEFRVVLEHDVVSARLANRDAGQTERALLALGYLLVQTRQLDMAMSSEQAIEQHKQKLLDGLAGSIDD